MNPARLSRRWAAAFYDALLLLAMWLVGALLASFFQEALHIAGDAGWHHLLRAWFFLIGLAYFGLSWTRGGQTVGMKAWRLRVLRIDGQPLRWPIATARYAAMLVFWTLTLAPLVLLAPKATTSHAWLAPTAWICLAALPLVTLWSRLDPLRLTPLDRITGSRVVGLPREAPASPDVQRRSAQPRQSPHADAPEQEGGRRR